MSMADDVEDAPHRGYCVSQVFQKGKAHGTQFGHRAFLTPNPYNYKKGKLGMSQRDAWARGVRVGMGIEAE